MVSAFSEEADSNSKRDVVRRCRGVWSAVCSDNLQLHFIASASALSGGAGCVTNASN